MQRKTFFKLLSTGAAGIALAAGCKPVTPGNNEQEGTRKAVKEIPGYRKSIKQSFSGGPGKSANDKVILALIGAGGYGTMLILETARSAENVMVKYICDVDDTRGGRAISELEKIQGVKPEKVRDMRVVFDDQEVDGVLIATPEHWHALATIWACQAGKDVYVEKPASHKLYEGQQMIKAAMKYERIVQVGTQNRSADYAYTAREYIKSGQLGEIVTVHVREVLAGPIPFNEKENTETPPTIDWDMWLGPAPKVPYNITRNKSWAYYWEYGGGLALSGGSIHQVDLARLVLGEPGFPKSVYCVGGRYLFEDNRDVPDYQMATFEYDNFVFTLEAGQFAPYMQKSGSAVRFGDLYPKWMQNATRIQILGTKGMMHVGRMGGGWQVFDKEEKIVAQDTGIYPLKAHVMNYVDCIRSRKQPNGNIVEGHNSSVLVHLANLSYRAGKKQLIFSPDYETILNDNKAEQMAQGSYREGYKIPSEI